MSEGDNCLILPASRKVATGPLLPSVGSTDAAVQRLEAVVERRAQHLALLDDGNAGLTLTERVISLLDVVELFRLG